MNRFRHTSLEDSTPWPDFPPSAVRKDGFGGKDQPFRTHVDSSTARRDSGDMADQRSMWGERTLVDRIGGAAYDYAVEREWLARPAGLAVWGTDTRVLFDAIRLIGDLPDGAAVLDVPCGGGLALRGLRSDQRLRYVGADISTDMLTRAR